MSRFPLARILVFFLIVALNLVTFYRKLGKQKLKKFQDIRETENPPNFESMDFTCSFFANIEEFPPALPKDIQILGNLMTLDITHETSIDSEQLNSMLGESVNTQGELQS